MKKLAISCLLISLVVTCVIAFSGSGTSAKSVVLQKKGAAQACIGAPPECMGGEP